MMHLRTLNHTHTFNLFSPNIILILKVQNGHTSLKNSGKGSRKRKSQEEKEACIFIEERKNIEILFWLA